MSETAHNARMHSLSKNTPGLLLKDAGVCFTGVDLASYVSKPTPVKTLADDLRTALTDGSKGDIRCIGATRGGGNVNVETTWRDVEVDGKRGDQKGLTEIDNVRVHLSTTLVEISAGNLEMALAASDVETNAMGTVIRPCMQVADDDYIGHFVWIGQRGDGVLVAVDIFNAINKSGASVTYTDKGEATLAIDMYGHLDDLVNPQYAPCMIYILENGAMTAMAMTLDGELENADTTT